MGGMPARRSTRAAIPAAILAVACLVAAAAPGATAALEGASSAPRQAIVEVATTPLPAGAETGTRRWRRLRAQAGDLLTRVSDANGLEVAARIPETGQLTIPLADGQGVAELRRHLGDDPRVTRVSADRTVELRLTPNDPGFTAIDPNAPGRDFRQWNVSREFGPPAWDLSNGSKAEVAVVDVGTDVSHPDLSGRIAGALDCVGGCSASDVNVSTTDGHGTHVAGLACATTNNGYGIASVGFGCSLFPIQIDEPGLPRGSCSDAAAAIVAAANRGSDAINMSFGGCDASLNNELEYALNRGSVPVAAVENEVAVDYSRNYPAQWVQPLGTGSAATFNRGLAVTAATHSGAVASWAQQDSGVSVAAFGAATNADGGQLGILSTWPNVACNPGCRATVNGDNRFAYNFGTSMATPQVAGVVALMRTVNGSLAAAEIASLIKQTASNCGQYTTGIGWGIVNAYRAVLAADPRDVDPPRSKAKRGRGKIRVKRGDDASTRPCTKISVKASGLKKVLLYVSVNGRDYRKLGKVKGKSVRFRGKKGKKYRFYSIAIDEAGNREAAPAEPDAKLNRKKKRRR